MRTLIQSIVLVLLLGYLFNYGNYLYHREPYVKKCDDSNQLCGVWGYSENNWIIEPQYENVHLYHPDMVGVLKKDKWGLINFSGKTILPNEYDSVSHKAMTGVVAKVVKGKLTGIINYKGKWLVEPIFDQVALMGRFKDTFGNDSKTSTMLACVGVKCRTININGEWEGDWE